jgi:hypothetical protein
VWLVNWFKKQDEGTSTPEEQLSILAVAMSIDDRVSLGWIGDEHNWKIRFTQSPREAFALASQRHFESFYVIVRSQGIPGAK